jgi:hypothetical protein
MASLDDLIGPDVRAAAVAIVAALILPQIPIPTLGEAEPAERVFGSPAHLDLAVEVAARLWSKAWES